MLAGFQLVVPQHPVERVVERGPVLSQRAIEREPVGVGVATTLPPGGKSWEQQCPPCVRVVSVNWVGMVRTENNTLLRKSVIFLVVLSVGWQVSWVELGRRTTR